MEIVIIVGVLLFLVLLGIMMYSVISIRKDAFGNLLKDNGFMTNRELIEKLTLPFGNEETFVVVDGKRIKSVNLVPYEKGSRIEITTEEPLRKYCSSEYLTLSQCKQLLKMGMDMSDATKCYSTYVDGTEPDLDDFSFFVKSYIGEGIYPTYSVDEVYKKMNLNPPKTTDGKHTQHDVLMAYSLLCQRVLNGEFKKK